jgi:hypothetical protein
MGDYLTEKQLCDWLKKELRDKVKEFANLLEGEKLLLIHLSRGIYPLSKWAEPEILNLKNSGYINYIEGYPAYFSMKGRERTLTYICAVNDMILHSIRNHEDPWQAEMELSAMLNISVGTLESVFLDRLVDERILIKVDEGEDGIYKIA